jgi:hypothetical protein
MKMLGERLSTVYNIENISIYIDHNNINVGWYPIEPDVLYALLYDNIGGQAIKQIFHV